MLASHSLSVDQITPTGRQVLVRRLDKEEMSRGGIALPSSRGERNMYCELIKVGPGFKRNNLDGETTTLPPVMVAKPGDIIALRQFEGTQVNNLGDGNLLLVDGRCVLGVRKSK